MKKWRYLFVTLFCTFFVGSLGAAVKTARPEKLLRDNRSHFGVEWVDGNLDYIFSSDGSPPTVVRIASGNLVVSQNHAVLDGTYFAFYSSGMLWRELQFSGGQRNGASRIYTENGKVACIEQYNDNVLESLTYFDQTGQKIATSQPTSDILVPRDLGTNTVRYEELLRLIVFEHICNNRDVSKPMLSYFEWLNQHDFFPRDSFLDFIVGLERGVGMHLSSLKYDGPLINRLIFTQITHCGIQKYMDLLREINELDPGLDYLQVILKQLAVVEDPDSLYYLQQLKKLYPQQSQMYSFYSNFIEGLRDYREGSYIRAADELVKCLDSIDLFYPDILIRVNVLMKIGVSLARVGKYSEALPYFANGFNRISGDGRDSTGEQAFYFYYYGLSLQQTGDYWEAVNYLTKLDSDSEALKLLGCIYIHNLESKRNAQQIIQRVSSLDAVVYNYLMDEYEKKFGVHETW